MDGGEGIQLLFGEWRPFLAVDRRLVELVEKAGFSFGCDLRDHRTRARQSRARDPLWIWNPWGRTNEVQNRSNQWLHKRIGDLKYGLNVFVVKPLGDKIKDWKVKHCLLLVTVGYI